MKTKKGNNNFSGHQTALVSKNTKLIEAELKDISGRAGVSFEDLDSLVRYVAKVTNIHRTTLKRNIAYKLLLRSFLARQQGSTSTVKIDDAPPELLRAMIEEQKLTISNLKNQVRILNEKINQKQGSEIKLVSHSESAEEIVLVEAASFSGNSDAAFQDTAFALLQLIQHINQTIDTETILIDLDNDLILDMAIQNPRKRRESAIGPERTKSFMTWYRNNKHLL